MKVSKQPARRALITGLGGFTGRYMAQSLMAAGYEVWGTILPHNLRDAPLPARCTGIAVDLLDADALDAAVTDARPDVVVHLAASAHAANGEPRHTYLVNVVGTRALLSALTKLDVRPRAVLLASSANVYGNARCTQLDESEPPRPANDYAVSKLAMEYAARLWLDRLPIFFTRPFNYTGVGQSDAYLLPKLVAHYARGTQSISLGNLDVSRDFSDVRDVVTAYARLLDVAPVGRTFNVCSERTYSLKEILAMLTRITGNTLDVKVDSRFVRGNEVHRLVGSRNKLRSVIGELPITPLEDTLHWMIKDARSKAPNPGEPIQS